MAAALAGAAPTPERARDTIEVVSTVLRISMGRGLVYLVKIMVIVGLAPSYIEELFGVSSRAWKDRA